MLVPPAVASKCTAIGLIPEATRLKTRKEEFNQPPSHLLKSSFQPWFTCRHRNILHISQYKNILKATLNPPPPPLLRAAALPRTRFWSQSQKPHLCLYALLTQGSAEFGDRRRGASLKWRWTTFYNLKVACHSDRSHVDQDPDYGNFLKF